MPSEKVSKVIRRIDEPVRVKTDHDASAMTRTLARRDEPVYDDLAKTGDVTLIYAFINL